jgi:hypothetical protein
VANEENLKPVTTEEEAREKGRAGGIASGKVRRERKAMKDTLGALLSMPMKEDKMTDIEEIQSLAELKGKNITVQEAIMLAQIQKAVKGDTKAAEYIRDTSGNKLKEALELSGAVDNPLAGLTTEELRKLARDD